MMQQMMQMLGKLNSNIERWNAIQEGARNTFPAQPDPNSRCQHPGSTSGRPQQEQAKAITVFRSGRAIGKEKSPPIPYEVDDGDKMESLLEQDQL